MLYHAYLAQTDLAWPWRQFSRAAEPTLRTAAQRLWREAGAGCAVFNLAEVTHQRPDWGVHDVVLGGVPVPVIESEHTRTPFATLRRFARPPGHGAEALPRVLLVAPMSGHFATLLRETVRTLVADHDVFVTDWHNARDVPLAAGRFGLTEYTQHLIDFLARLGPRAHLVAICQPCVAALAATALMAEDDHPCVPASLTLMAGPIDCRVAPTTVNALATSRPIEWFERHLISTVPWRLRGFGRRVYPGFVQLMAFMNMNRERHRQAFEGYRQALLDGDAAKIDATRRFYEEYLAVADLPAEFYLETVEQVFQRFLLPRGELRVGGRLVNPAAIRRTALLTIEGERDDICSVGQTLAAQDLCTQVRPYLRTHYVQAGVGHYGVFSGKRWQQQIYPVLRDTIHHAPG